MSSSPLSRGFFTSSSPANLWSSSFHPPSSIPLRKSSMPALPPVGPEYIIVVPDSEHPSTADRSGATISGVYTRSQPSRCVQPGTWVLGSDQSTFATSTDLDRRPFALRPALWRRLSRVRGLKSDRRTEDSLEVLVEQETARPGTPQPDPSSRILLPGGNSLEAKKRAATIEQDHTDWPVESRDVEDVKGLSGVVIESSRICRRGGRSRERSWFASTVSGVGTP
mmetsp:Transcript_24213/g.48154  ORF Transcript_24213/g.48154 Transcript_24213/m.48154 type:complete len:224 (+) Transcript_24213:168-839(+)